MFFVCKKNRETCQLLGLFAWVSINVWKYPWITPKTDDAIVFPGNRSLLSLHHVKLMFEFPTILLKTSLGTIVSCKCIFKAQVWNFAYIRLLSKPYENEVTLRGQNICLKYYQPLEFMLYFGKGFRSFNNENLGSVGKRASKLLAVKVGVLW